jgi:ankyrin repeat protein
LAAKYGQVEFLKFLLVAGANVNHAGPDGRTPLYYAIYSRSNEAVRLLVASGALLDVRDSVGYSPYDYAVSRSQTEILELLRSRNEED